MERTEIQQRLQGKSTYFIMKLLRDRFTISMTYNPHISRDSESENPETDVLVINEFGLNIVDDLSGEKEESAPCISIPELEPGLIQVQLPPVDNNQGK